VETADEVQFFQGFLLFGFLQDTFVTLPDIGQYLIKSLKLSRPRKPRTWHRREGNVKATLGKQGDEKKCNQE
jgi:hypothetical protein